MIPFASYLKSGCNFSLMIRPTYRTIVLNQTCTQGCSNNKRVVGTISKISKKLRTHFKTKHKKVWEIRSHAFLPHHTPRRKLEVPKWSTSISHGEQKSNLFHSVVFCKKFWNN